MYYNSKSKEQMFIPAGPDTAGRLKNTRDRRYVMFYGFDTDIARDYGVNEAIMLQNLYFWLQKNRASQRNYHDGRYWTYNSHRAIAQQFPFWSERQVRYLLDKLVAKGLLLKGNYNAHKYDRTLWYAFTDQGEALFGLGDPPGPESPMELPETAPADGQSGRMEGTGLSDEGARKGAPIPDTDQIHKPDTDQITAGAALPPALAAPRTDHAAVQAYWNTHCTGLPKVTVMSPKRQQALGARIREHGEAAVYTVVDKTAASHFLNGRNKRGWKANFDWVMGPEHFVRVLEGHYDNPAVASALPDNLEGALSNLEAQMLAEAQEGGCLF